MSSNSKTGSNNASSAVIGFSGSLTILFIALKLTGVINWSWVWVLSPLWISFGIVMLALIAFLLLVWAFSK